MLVLAVLHLGLLVLRLLLLALVEVLPARYDTRSLARLNADLRLRYIFPWLTVLLIDVYSGNKLFVQELVRLNKSD